MKNEFPEFVIAWHEMAEICAGIFLFIAVIIVLFYFIGCFLSKKRTSLYQYVSEKEIITFKSAILFVSLGIVFYVNSLLTYAMKTASNIELGAQVFSSFMVGVIFYFIAKTIMDVYYPSILEKKLTRIRFKKFNHPITGNPMRLLNEDEEDVHLTEEMIENENIFAYDYDVWIDEITNEKIIEKYDVHHTHQICSECKFRTLKEKKEEIINKPTMTTEGLLMKSYECSFCQHKEKHEVKVAPLVTN
ncbi:MAG: hypothetical protein ACI9GZ_000951 [Bacteroidia bacterium]|jgi:hypothetical protein